MPVEIAIVQPIPPAIHVAYTPVSGYYVADAEKDVAIRLDGEPLIVSQENRSDLLKVYPGRTCRGFHAVIDIGPNSPTSHALEIEVDGVVIHRGTLAIDAAAFASSRRSAIARASNRRFVLDHLACSHCGASLAGDAPPARCPACATAFDQHTRAVSAVPAGTYPIPRTVSTSFCGYDMNERDLIASVGPHGRVLDFGAGLRPETNEAVISLEIADMPSTDVISVADRLPFDDDTFDAAMSLHVLEHVPRPWLIAKELQRVVKPGGIILSTVPYVCPVHGFPFHFFSMTPRGLRSLFEEADFVSHTLKGDSHPINGLRQLLGTYAGSLTPELRQQFEALTVADMLAGDLGHMLAQPWVAGLNEHAQWEMPAHSTLTVRKPARPAPMHHPDAPGRHDPVTAPLLP